MSPEETIRYAIRNFPTLFHDTGRAGVLHHLFFVNGNGYDWVNGELVDPYDNEEYERPRRPIEDAPEILRDIYETVEREIAAIRQEVRENLDEYCAMMVWPAPHRVYPLCQYADVLNIPDDVTADWKAAAVEALEFFAPMYDGEDRTKLMEVLGNLLTS